MTAKLALWGPCCLTGVRRGLAGMGGICCRPCHSSIMVGSRALLGSQSPQPHLEDGSVYRPLWPTIG